LTADARASVGSENPGYNHDQFKPDWHYERPSGRVPTTWRKNSDHFRPAVS